MMEEKIGIYIHIPFCVSRCYYCDFVSYSNKDELIEEYINALCNEILQNSEILSQYKIATVYFGGGTPSYIDSKYIVKIMETLKLFCSDYEFEEVTIEINPNSADIDKLLDYKKCGINRISIGLQSTHDNILKLIGRAHKYEDFEKLMKDIKKVGFCNVSVDLIYPLPSLTLNLLDESLNKVIDLSKNYNIEHISVYNLEVHDGSKLEFLLNEGFLTLPDEDEEYQMRELIDNTLKSNGFYKYEISNYSKEGFESKHNLMYWNQERYLGFGVNASSFFAGSRYRNTKSIEEYIKMSNNFSFKYYDKEDLDKLDLMKEYIILKLRLKNGVNTDCFKKRFNTNIFDIFKQEIEELLNNKLIDYEDNNIFLTKRGMEVANLVWEKFI